MGVWGKGRHHEWRAMIRFYGASDIKANHLQKRYPQAPAAKLLSIRRRLKA
jgi:hypothetical protein